MTAGHPHADRALIASVRRALADAGDAARATSMRTYMKSAMLFYGVPAPGVAAIERAAYERHPLPRTAEGYDAWRDTVLALFREATHREERYVALRLATRTAYLAHARRRETLAVAEVLVTEGAWWDIVDTVASGLLGGLHAQDPEWMAAQMRAWSVDQDMWKRRASIISQLRRRQDVDLPLLYDCIEPNLADGRLSGLSKREALKNVLKSGRVPSIP